MTRYEYQVVPAPNKGTKAKGVKAPEARFSLMLQDLMNEKGAEGWEYQRAETLPSEERKGLTGSATNWRHVLIFRREIAEALPAPIQAQVAEVKQEIAPPPAPAEPAPAPFVSAPRPVPQPVTQPVTAPSARDTWAEEIPAAPRPAPSLNPLAAPRRNPENSDV